MRATSLVVLAGFAGVSWAGEPAAPQARDVFADTWAATDALGRKMPLGTGVRKDRYVGVFYFLWLGQHGTKVYDNSKILALNPQQPEYGPEKQYHFWGEPIWGYYRSTDEGVIRKQVQMLADAGVDVLICDVTNAVTYDNVVKTLCKVLEEMRSAGNATPQIAFITHSQGAKTVRGLYDRFYAKGTYKDLWFQWKGKPLILAEEAGLDAELKQFFTVRESWAWTKGQAWFGDGKDKWPWLDHTPQTPGWHDVRTKAEEISVAVAEHPTSNIGRSYHGGKEPSAGLRAAAEGLYFAEQWKRALEVDPEFVFVTGWNEWIAMRFINDGAQPFLGRTLAKGESFFVDEYNEEYSRDIEPMKGGHGDNYYYQLAQFVRRYKGARALPAVTSRPIQIDGKFDDWRAVAPEYRDTIGDAVRRNDAGYEGAGPYVNRTGRNDLVAAKVSADEKNVYFYVRTAAAITPHTDPNWMLLFIDADANARTGWLGYDFVVNRLGVGDGKTRLEKNLGGKYEWGSGAQVEYRAAGNEMELAIPRAALGIRSLPATIEFKWADNIQQTGEWWDFTVNGDAAPNDRFNYRARLERN